MVYSQILAGMVKIPKYYIEVLPNNKTRDYLLSTKNDENKKMMQ
jgi:hypothetical protein